MTKLRPSPFPLPSGEGNYVELEFGTFPKESLLPLGEKVRMRGNCYPHPALSLQERENM